MVALLLVGGAVAGYASMASADSSTATGIATAMPMRAPHVGGTIAAINGTTLTITSDANHGRGTSGTYTIDASNATVTKAGATAALSSFVVGEKIWATGTISGTSVVATAISDAGGKGPGGFGRGKGHGVMGTVTAVNGSTVTVTGKDGVSYTVNAGSATVQRMVTGALSDITVGDTIGVQGTVSGTTVTATTIMDGVPQMPAMQ